jgi:hypothetical protein
MGDIAAGPVGTAVRDPAPATHLTVVYLTVGVVAVGVSGPGAERGE